MLHDVRIMKTVSKKNQITVLVVVAALTLVTYMALNLQMKNQDKLESMFKQNQQDIALHASKRIEAFIDDESQHLILLSNEISTGVSGNVLSDKLMAEINQSLPHLFKRHIKSVSVYNAAGTIIYSTLKTAIGLNYAKSSFFEWASKQTDNNQIYLSDFVRTDSVQSSKPPYYRILIVSPILREISNASSKYFSKTFIGAVTYSIDINELLTEQLAFINNGAGQQKAWVMDKDGTLLFYLTHEEMLLNNIHKVDKSCTKCHDSFDYIKPILRRETGTLDYQLKDKTKKLAAFATMKIGNITWKIVANSPYEQITSFTENNLRQTIALIGIVVLVLAGGFVLVYKNYGSRVRAEEEAKRLREKEVLKKEAGFSEEKFRILAEESPNMIFINKSGRVVYANKKCVDVMGYTLEELYSPEFSFLNLIAPEYVNMVKEIYSQRFTGLAKTSYEYGLITKKGKRLDAIITISLIDYENEKALIGTVTDITERKMAEAALAENEKRYRTLFENAPAGIAMLDADNHILLINKGFESIFQYTLDEAKGRFIDELIVPAELGNEANAMSLESQHGGIVKKETFRKRKDGTPVLVQVYGVPITVNNKCIGIYGMYVDMTERKRAEQRIADTLKLNETILQTSPMGIIAYKINGETISANEAAAKIVGTTVDRLLRQNFRQLESWKRSGLFEAADKVLKTGTRQSLETHLVTTFKKEIWISCLLESFKYENEGHLLLVFEDVSQRIQSEKENRMLAHAVESVSECVSITDHNDIIIFVNDSFLATYGYKKEELVGKHVSILRPPDIAAAMVKDILPETIKGGWKGEVLNRKKDGTIFPVLLSTSVIKNDLEEPIALIGVATDITEVKKVQEELIAAKELAEKSAALKSEFLAQMSHEIRSPMNVTLSFANMLKEDMEDLLTPEMTEYFEGIELAGKRLIRTVDLILNASEMQVGTYEPIWGIVNLQDDIFKSIYTEYASYARRKGLELNIYSKVSDSRTKGDRYSILQIFANLVDNAIKYTNTGKVEVTIDRDENNWLEVTVEDTGIGISEEFMNRIFQPFMQEDRGYSRKYEGNGLGLSLVKKYCDLNEAEINIESEKGKGSKFIVAFKKN